MSLKPNSSISTDMTVTRRFLKSSFYFVLIGLFIYLALYAISEQLVYNYAKRNRFFAIKTATTVEYDYVILGASHAAALDYEDMTPRLEQMTNARIINLSEVGAGITVNCLLLDYFLVSHRTKTVVYMIDSFAFYSPQWNEDRLNDTRLFVRAPFDPVLVQVLLQKPAFRGVMPDYILGFSKINNPDRFAPDINDDERTKFNTTYRPVKQIDQQRLDYLYPKQIDEVTFQRYLGEFENLVRYLKERNVRLVVIKPPLPVRVYAMLPSEEQFDQTLQGVLGKYNVEFYDWSKVDNDDKFFFNTDHLNRMGVLNFFNRLVKVLPGFESNR